MSEAHPIDLAEFCPRYEAAMGLLGKRWTGLILRALLSGCDRFGSIAAYVPGLSDRVLSERLKELEAEGIIGRHVHPETPVRIEYRLTPKGEELRQIVESVQTWADRWVEAETPQARSQHPRQDVYG